MVKLIIGLKGSGKTKRLVELVREAVAMDNGDVVCIEKEQKLTYDIPYQARLVEAGAYDVKSYEAVKGFVCGLHSGNYDITHVFIDNFFKLVGNKDTAEFAKFVAWLNAFSEKESVEFVISASIDPEELDDTLKSYMI